MSDCVVIFLCCQYQDCATPFRFCVTVRGALAVADADVITALTTVGILEPATTTTPTGTAETAADGAPREGGEIAETAAGAGSAGGRPGPAFKPKDTAELRAVAVQVEEKEHIQ